MSIERTLGGDRLGSGNKQNVEMRTYNRSTHNLNTIVRTTMASGTLVPFLSLVGLPGDTLEIDLDADIMTHPTVGPLFGSYKVQLDVFTIPVRLYNAKLHNNALKIGLNMSQIKLPQLLLRARAVDETKPIDNQQMNPSSIFKYLGISGLGQKGTGWGNGNTFARRFNAVPYLGYWDIYKNYYANKQEEIGAVIHSAITPSPETIDEIEFKIWGVAQPNLPKAPASIGVDTGAGEGVQLNINYTGAEPNPSQIIINTDLGEFSLTELFQHIEAGNGINPIIATTALSGGVFINWRYATGTDLVTEEPQVYTFPLDNIDDMRMNILAAANSSTAFQVDEQSPEPYKLALGLTGTTDATYRFNCMNTQEGLAIKTYQSDLFNNWIETEWIDGTNGIAEITSVDTTGNSFTIDALNFASKLYTLLNRVALSDGSYKSWIETVYTSGGYWRAETPSYVGGLSKELVFQEVISNTQTAEQPLGTLAGRGRLNEKHKGGKVVIKPDEMVYIMGIVSLTPRIDYSQGNQWDVNLETMDDFHKPQLDGIGFEDLITDGMAWWETTVSELGGTIGETYRSAGKVPAWINYMTNVNRTYGNFAIPTNEMFMTLNRRYEYNPTTNRIKDLTTYIDPVKFNHIFAQTSRDAQNFWVQIGADIKARRVISAKIIPNL